MTATCEMEMTDLADIILRKADTLIASSMAIGAGWKAWKYREENDGLKKAEARAADLKNISTEVDIYVKVANELKVDFQTMREQLKEELKECHDSKAALAKRVDEQEVRLFDLAKNLGQSMERQGLPDGMKIKINPDHILPPKV